MAVKFGRLFSKARTSCKKTTMCAKCKLHKLTHSGKLPVLGKGKAKIMVVIGHPTLNDDIGGGLLSDDRIDILDKAFKDEGYDLYEDIAIVSATACYVDTKDEDNKTAIGKSVTYCYANVFNAIKKYKPNVIIPMGLTAIKSVMGKDYSRGITSSDMVRGFSIPHPVYEAWIIPTDDLDFMWSAFLDGEKKNRDTYYETIDKIFTRDIMKACSFVNVPIEKYVSLKKACKVLTEEEAITWIKQSSKEMKQEFKSGNDIYLAWDIEASGLRPQDTGHFIYSISLCWKPDEAVSFLWTDKVRNTLKPILETSKIKKLGWNMRYEDVWLDVLADIKIGGWFCDGMLMSHILDNRKGITSLKFQSYINHGIKDYESNVKPYLKSDTNNGINRIKEAPVKDVLYYGAIDSLLTRSLNMKMMRQIGKIPVDAV